MSMLFPAVYLFIGCYPSYCLARPCLFSYVQYVIMTRIINGTGQWRSMMMKVFNHAIYRLQLQKQNQIAQKNLDQEIIEQNYVRYNALFAIL